MSVRVLVADDHPVVREGLRFALERAGAGIEVVAEAGDGQEALALAANGGVDVFVLDVTMPRLDGLATAGELLRRDPAARVIMLSLHDSADLVDEALRTGARGYLPKTAASCDTVQAVLAVHAGGLWLDPRLARRAKAATSGAPGPHPGRRLTRRERQVLQLVGEGHPTPDIAARLGIAENTVHKHRANLMAKLDIHDRVELARYAIREGFARP